jgi:hypothetical protein
MKKFCCKLTFFMFLLTILLPLSNSQAITIGLSPVNTSSNVGSSVNVSLFISGLGAGSAPSIGEYDIDVNFDPLILAFSSVSFGDPILGDQLDIFGLGSFTQATLGVGSINLFQLSFDTEQDLNDFQSPEFTLATLTFDLLGEGTSALGLSLWSLASASGEGLVANLVNGSVNSTAPVPEPTSMLLFGTGLTCFALCKKIKKHLKK